jgi:hypothetical protein
MTELWLLALTNVKLNINIKRIVDVILKQKRGELSVTIFGEN